MLSLRRRPSAPSSASYTSLDRSFLNRVGGKRSRISGGLLLLISILIITAFEASSSGIVVVDSVTGAYLPRASVYDRFGNLVAYTNKKGRIPAIKENDFPLTIRYLGFIDKAVPNAFVDSVFMREEYLELPEFVLDADNRKVLHLLAYVREYSKLTTYTDTVALFREKMVDFMYCGDTKGKFKGWMKPRVLASQSYYRFTDSQGKDSVSDECNHHFSWADWIGIVPDIKLPSQLIKREEADAVIHGKYSPVEKWSKVKDNVTVNINVLADTVGRRWIPGLYGFFHRDKNLERFVDFEKINLLFDYDNVTGDALSPENLNFYSYNIESVGRGHGMFRFGKNNERFFVSTDAEVYILDKEYITVKEARQWESHKIDIDDKTIYSPLTAPELAESEEKLIERVENIDKEKIKLDVPPDFKFVGADLSRKNFRFGNRLLHMLKLMTGISAYKSKKKLKNNWKAFRKKQQELNERRLLEDFH